MRVASISLALTACYVLVAVYALEAARVLGPIYAVTVLSLYLTTRPRKHRRG